MTKMLDMDKHSSLLIFILYSQILITKNSQKGQILILNSQILDIKKIFARTNTLAYSSGASVTTKSDNGTCQAKSKT